MSAASRFAPMTADLLARKGEARPFNLLSTDKGAIDRRDVVREFDASMLALPLKSAVEASPSTRPEKPSAMNGVSIGPNESPRANGAARPASEPGALLDAGFSAGKLPAARRHSISLSVTDNEFERLGLIAVKKRVNKQQLLRLAIDHYLDKLAAEYRSACQCISAGPCCSGSAD